MTERNIEQLEEARARMHEVMKNLVVILGPHDALAAMAGTLVNALLYVHGQAGMVQYLRELTDAAARMAPPTDYSLN
jgi:hypothetical protein